MIALILGNTSKMALEVLHINAFNYVSGGLSRLKHPS
jgi:hypothetical protein